MNLFQGIFNANEQVISVGNFLLCVFVSLLIGAFLSAVYSYKNTYTRSFMITLFLLPAMVCVVIMMVNGNLGAGVAVAGAFSLVRFRSAAGSAKDISMIFLAMASGLIAGMGYLAYACLFAVLLGLMMLLLMAAGFGMTRKPSADKTLKLSVPENIDYASAFEEIFDSYTSYCENVSVKTSAKDKGYKLNYSVTLKDAKEQKAFIDALSAVDGKIEVSLTRREVNNNEL